MQGWVLTEIFGCGEFGIFAVGFLVKNVMVNCACDAPQNMKTAPQNMKTAVKYFVQSAYVIATKEAIWNAFQHVQNVVRRCVMTAVLLATNAMRVFATLVKPSVSFVKSHFAKVVHVLVLYAGTRFVKHARIVSPKKEDFNVCMT